MNKSPKIIAGVLVLLFTAFAVFTPSVFAQTPSGSDQTAQAHQYMDLISSVFSYVMQRYVEEVDPKVLYQGALTGLMDSLGDKHTVYLNASDQRNLTDTTSGEFGGVGLNITKATVSTKENPAFVEVASPIEGTPGWKAGIKAGDLLVEIDGVYTPDITMDEVLDLLRGQVGEPVEVKVRRGKNMEFTVTMIRALIEVPTVQYKMISNDGHRTGYLHIKEFTPQTPERVQEALDAFGKENYDSLIIDLRNNPGGLITSVNEVADKFISSGTIVATKGRLPSDNSVYSASASKTTFPQGIPIVVMIDAGSASASEILTGALKDTKMAYVVGENSYGKGSVQIPVSLPYGDGIKLTIARYYSPSDSNIDEVGIPPDLEVLFPEFTEEEQDAYVALVEADAVNIYVDEHPGMTEEDIAAYAEGLSKEYALPLSILRRIIRVSVYRYSEFPVYDLDYDIQLQKSLEIVTSDDVWTLIRNTKTLKEIEEARSLEEDGLENS